MSTERLKTAVNTMQARRVGIDTYREPVVYMRRDCAVCRSEGFAAQARVQMSFGTRRVIATLNIVEGDWLGEGEAGLSESTWSALQPSEGAILIVSHAPPLDSLSHVRARVYGHRLDVAGFGAVIGDIAAGRYSDLHLAAFVTACGGDRLDGTETLALTQAMIDVGERLDWGRDIVVDKHCVGGLPGNRTTLLVVPIVAVCGLTMPKTSSRAITSPAGTADTMEVLAPVDLDIAAMRHVVERTGACIVWGGAMRLSPADDMLIRVARSLDLDSEGQLVASVLSKKSGSGIDPRADRSAGRPDREGPQRSRGTGARQPPGRGRPCPRHSRRPARDRRSPTGRTRHRPGARGTRRVGRTARPDGRTR